MKTIQNLQKSIEIKFLKGKFLSYIRYPIYLIQKKSWQNKTNSLSTQDNISEFNNLLEERFRFLSQGIPKINTNIEIKTSEILEKIFDKELIEDKKKKLLISKYIGKKLIHINPNAAYEFIKDSISLIEQIYGKFHPDLIELNLIKSNLAIELGELENSYYATNSAFLLTLLNYSYYSLQMVEVIDYMRRFSLRIEETKEHEIYSQKIEAILNVIYKRNKDEKENEENLLIHLCYYKMKIIDGLIQCSKGLNNNMSMESLKDIHNKYDFVLSDNLLNKYICMQLNSLNNYDLSSKEMILYIKYVNIKIRNIFRKDSKDNIVKELINLIKIIKEHLGQYSVELIFPYILLIRIYSTYDDLQKLDNFIMKEWCDLLSNCFEENYLLISNYTFILIRELVFKDNDLRLKLSNLLNFVGENYESYFNFKEDPSKTENNFFYAEMCFLGAYLARADSRLNPLEMAASSANIYLNLLGATSEKYKLADNLFESLEKKYNKKY